MPTPTFRERIALILLIPACIWSSGLSFASWLSPGNAEGRERRKLLFNWYVPVAEPGSEGDRNHWRKNRLTEYCRGNAQVASKAGSFLILTFALLAILGWLATAVSIAVALWS